MAKKHHVIIIPYPAQGHTAPLMKLAYKLSDHGIKVTFVNSESVHGKATVAVPEKFKDRIPINLISISNGLKSNSDKTDGLEELASMSRFTPENLQNLIDNLDVKVSCIIADVTLRGAVEVAKKMGIKLAGVVPYGVGNFASQLHAPELIRTGIMDADGIPLKDAICLSKVFPPFKSNELIWSMPGETEMQKFIYGHFFRGITEVIDDYNWLLVNSFSELEPSACDLIPDALPIGLLIANDNSGQPFAGTYYPEDSTCLTWLDQQPQGSVIYFAFGSVATCNQQQLNELAIGLEMIGRPFLWVVRPNFTRGMHIEFPDGFKERVASYGQIVEWAPQEKVLAHPSIACFFSHCGWNSTTEGITAGVPFLCWPFFLDQFHNRDYICEAWKVGLKVIPDENGIVTRHEIKAKIEKLLADKDIKANSLKLKEMARKSISEGGSSFKNFISFVEQIKQ